MKTIKLLHIALFCITVTLLSCSLGIEDDGLMTKHVQLRVQASRGIYTEESNQKAPSNAESWKDGDKLYLASSTGVKGVATYGSKGWILDYSGNVSNAESCDLYYFENAEYHTDAKVGLNANSCVYFDSNAKLRNVDDEIILEGHLAPKNARFRFKANDGTEASITGFTYFSEFSVSTQGLTESNCVEEVKLVSKNGYTPYTYVSFNGNKQELTINANDCVFSRELTEKELSSGHSGYFVVPTKTNLNGWSFISEAPAPVWDGTKSSSFAGGSGTFADPYLIKTGGQLLHIMDINTTNTYFVLKNNIDLNNYNWRPFEMLGTFDGAGFTINNLKIERDEYKVGLFSEAHIVKDLTIKGVQINSNKAGSGNDCIGALAGKLSSIMSGSSVNNVNVILTEGSYIKGNYANVGGIVGYIGPVITIENCSVESESDDFVILGNRGVGGIVGSAVAPSPNWNNGNPNIINCHVKANIAGSDLVGGVVGTGDSNVTNCSYTGKIKAVNYVGGIVGSQGGEVGTITACKVVGDIEGISYVGGLIGYNHVSTPYTKLIACYFTGKVHASNYYSCYIGGGNSQGPAFLYLCYAATDDNYPTPWSGRQNDCAETTGNNPKEDISTYLQETYSEYSKYYNFSNKWYWKGTINGKQVSVPCPKLSWE